jgi:putative phosphoribosyl transferase
MVVFKNRYDAGQKLAEKLMHYHGQENLIVLGLPRGGVPVAYEVARALDAPLDVLVVRKLGVPDQEELAMGAIASGGARVFNTALLQALNLSRKHVEDVIAREERELERREKAYRGTAPPLKLEAKTVILVDDGLATGATMRAAVKAVKMLNPRAVVVAIPVAAESTCQLFASLVDEIVCVTTPEPFHAVGLWYMDFAATSDSEVRNLLNMR